MPVDVSRLWGGGSGSFVVLLHLRDAGVAVLESNLGYLCVLDLSG